MEKSFCLSPPEVQEPGEVAKSVGWAGTFAEAQTWQLQLGWGSAILCMVISHYIS